MPVKTHSNESSMLYVRVTPKAARTRIGAIAQGADGLSYLKIYVVEVPEAGKANAAVITLLSKQLKIPQSSFQLVFGATDKYKRFKINMSADELRRALQLATGSLF